jgi:hypothetical protein
MDIILLPLPWKIILILTLSFELFAQNKIAADVIAGGGGNMNSADYSVSGTIGQPFVGTGSSANNFIMHGFWHNSLLLTDINEDYNIKPKEFKLYQNYPNPFNPSTIISWQLPSDSHVLIKVYDILGNEIATLINEEKPAGTYRIKFDASSLSSGVYIYRIQTDSFKEVKKMILLR